MRIPLSTIRPLCLAAAKIQSLRSSDSPRICLGRRTNRERCLSFASFFHLSPPSAFQFRAQQALGSGFKMQFLALSPLTPLLSQFIHRLLQLAGSNTRRFRIAPTKIVYLFPGECHMVFSCSDCPEGPISPQKRHFRKVFRGELVKKGLPSPDPGSFLCFT